MTTGLFRRDSTVYVVAPNLLWARAWADAQFRSGALQLGQVYYSTGPGALQEAVRHDVVVLVNPVMCTGRRWQLVKEVLALRCNNQFQVIGASTEPLFRFTARMKRNPRFIPFEPKPEL